MFIAPEGAVQFEFASQPPGWPPALWVQWPEKRGICVEGKCPSFWDVLVDALPDGIRERVLQDCARLNGTSLTICRCAGKIIE